MRSLQRHIKLQVEKNTIKIKGAIVFVTNALQTNLSRLQAIPVVGPVVFSPAKAVLSTAQMVAGLAVGILFGAAATTCGILGLHPFAAGAGIISLHGFASSISGFGSLFYACANIATLGVLGLTCELNRRCHPLPHHGWAWGHFMSHHHHHKKPTPLYCC